MSEPRVQIVRVDGWRDAPNGVGPHREADSCDLEPVCGHIYRAACVPVIGGETDE